MKRWLNQFCAARHLLVSFSGRPYGFIDESLALLKRERRVVLTVNQFFTAGRVVANSNLLTVLPRHFVEATGIAEQLVHQDLPFDVAAVHVAALWHRRTDLQSHHQWLRQAVVRCPSAIYRLADPDRDQHLFTTLLILLHQVYVMSPRISQRGVAA